MRVAIFFISFGFLFAFVLPQMVSSFMTEDEDPVARQLMQGADPTEILQETASGFAETTCGSEGYQYLQTADGQHYIKSDESQYIAALIDNNPRFYKIREDDQVADIYTGKVTEIDNAQQLERVLLDCSQIGNVRPATSLLTLADI